MVPNLAAIHNSQDHTTFVPTNGAGTTVNRDELARQLVSMYGHAAPNLSENEIQEFDSLFTDLSAAISPQTRLFLSSSLAPISNAPHGISFRLARDTIEIARPILIQSTVLTDEDLVLICDEHPTSHMIAIAQRPVISPTVSDVLVFRGDDLVRVQVARNEGAQISPRGFSRLAGQARSDQAMEQILVGRPDLPGIAVHIMVKFGSKTVREYLEPSITTQSASLDGLTPAQRAKELDGLDFAVARARVDQMAQQGQFGESQFMRLVAEEKLAESLVTLSRIVGVSLSDVKSWYLEKTPETLLIAARAYGIDSRAIFGLLGLGRWRHNLDSRSRQAAMQRYQQMPKPMAVKLLGNWRKERRENMLG